MWTGERERLGVMFASFHVSAHLTPSLFHIGDVWQLCNIHRFLVSQLVKNQEAPIHFIHGQHKSSRVISRSVKYKMLLELCFTIIALMQNLLCLKTTFHESRKTFSH